MVIIEDLEFGKKYKFLFYGFVGGKCLGLVFVLGMIVLEEDMLVLELVLEVFEFFEEFCLGVLVVIDIVLDFMCFLWSVV